MLIAFDPSSGTMRWNSGTNSGYPWGPPDEIGYQVAGEDASLFRLHDITDASVVQRVFTAYQVRIDNGRVVIQDRAPSSPLPPEPETPSPTLPELLAMIQAQQGQIAEQTAALSASQAQLDELTIMVLGGIS